LQKRQYVFAAWVNIPNGTSATTLTLRSVWLNSTGGTVTTTTAPVLTGPTSGWTRVSKSVMLPTGAVSARVELVAKTKSGAIVDFDDVTFRPDNQLVNAGFETDANGDTRPDTWFSLSRFVQSTDVVYSGAYSAVANGDGSGFTPGEKIHYIQPGTTYYVSAWINVPDATASYFDRVRVRWLDVANVTVSVPNLVVLTTSTPGWIQVSGAVVAPAGATQANLEFNLSGLTVQLYTDAAFFGPA
jgi:hypothetical protein